MPTDRAPVEILGLLWTSHWSAQQANHGYLRGALVSGMVYLGDEMGLYRAMHEQGPITSDQVAARAGLHERLCVSGSPFKQLQA